MLTFDQKTLYTRQEGILDPKLLKGRRVSIIGNGSVGSFTALSLCKMGIKRAWLYDDDGVSPHNLPNQYFRKQDIGQFKVDALADILSQFSDADVRPLNKKYRSQKLKEVVIVATDSMSSRKLVWEQFKKQPQALVLIEARMGAELGQVYMIQKQPFPWRVTPKDLKFYEERLYSDEEAKELPCTARSIIYNVLMISSLICRAYKGWLNKEKYPREVTCNLTFVDERSFMLRWYW